MMSAQHVGVQLSPDELQSLGCLARRYDCSPQVLAGLLIYRGLMDGLTGRFDPGMDAKDIRNLQLHTD